MITTATAKSCFICFRPTTTVLATINTAVEQEKPKVSDEEIKRIKEEWEEKQRRKEKAGDKEKDKNSDKDKKESSPKPKSTPPGPTPMPVITTTTTPKPTHERYVLHRSIWAMRLAEHKKKRQATAAKQVAPRLPIAPRSVPAFPPASSS
ncbi:hypothetical protein Clacol_001873 [Clathrus columnatus]|uniref:Uncharacterized protein n=1 Tax=Clathrus columnatus TaxID=1419009 RepID=A0AAV5A2E5_9AGAM|nr:hypothetical protein Clacol_001873 [Clathrus columnatus]